MTENELKTHAAAMDKLRKDFLEWFARDQLPQMRNWSYAKVAEWRQSQWVKWKKTHGGAK